MKEKLISTIKEEKLIVIVRGIEKSKLIPLTQAMYDGGVRLIEITYDSTGKVSDEETAESIKILANRFGDKMFIGAGTVLTEKQVKLTKNAGGSFIISPNVNPKIIKKTLKLNMVSIPGAFSPSEIELASELGADFVKLFPITNLGADYLKAVKAPLSHVNFLAVGGINLDNISTYLKAGACGFGIGSNIIDKEMIKTENYKGITELASKYCLAVK